MTKEWQLQEFPLDEIAMLNKITSKFNNWKYINMEQEDLVQEVILKLLQNKERWMELREKSTSSTLIYYALKNHANKVWDQQVKRNLSYDEETIAFTIINALNNKDGRIYDLYLTLPDKSKQYIDKVYCKNREVMKKDIKEELKLTQSEVVITERKITNEARFYIKDTEGLLS